jgi:peroxiredoxin
MPVSAGDRVAQLGYAYDRYEQAPKAESRPAAQASPAQTSPANSDSRGSANSYSDASTSARSTAPAWSLRDASGKTVSLSQYKGRPVVLIFYEGSGCIRCRGQLNSFAQKAREFADSGINLVAIGIDTPEQLKELVADSKEEGAAAFPLLSDARLEVFKTYHCVDFENQPMHGVFLIDAQGRLRSQRISDKPFNDPALVLKEAKELGTEVAVR